MAQVYHAYEKHMPKMRMYAYQAKARFNEENFQILDLFMKQRQFKIISFAMDKTIKQEYEGVVKSHAKHL